MTFRSLLFVRMSKFSVTFLLKGHPRYVWLTFFFLQGHSIENSTTFTEGSLRLLKILFLLSSQRSVDYETNGYSLTSSYVRLLTLSVPKYVRFSYSLLFRVHYPFKTSWEFLWIFSFQVYILRRFSFTPWWHFITRSAWKDEEMDQKRKDTRSRPPKSLKLTVLPSFPYLRGQTPTPLQLI